MAARHGYRLLDEMQSEVATSTVSATATDHGSKVVSEDVLVALRPFLVEPKLTEPSQENPMLPAGYTYLGQFVAHDLSFSISHLSPALPVARGLTSRRRQRLDLDSVYGGGPDERRALYQDANWAKFRVNGNAPHDLPRVGRQALIADPRNDDNLVVAQLHLVFTRLHNLVVDRLTNGRTDRAWLFRTARSLVIDCYQWIVVHDLLHRVLEPKVWGELANETLETKSVDADEAHQAFALAAFRWHGLVRTDYRVNSRHSNVHVNQIMGRTGNGQRLESTPNGCGFSLARDWAIAWRGFFPIKTDEVPAVWKPARLFSHRPIEFLAQAGPRESRSMGLGERTIRSGLASRLPDAQSLATRFGVPLLDAEQVLQFLPGEFPGKSELLATTPLWLYLMREAELEGEGGQRLGMLGSRIVAYVIDMALQQSTRDEQIDTDERPALEGIVDLRPDAGASPMVKLLRFLEAA